MIFPFAQYLLTFCTVVFLFCFVFEVEIIKFSLLLNEHFYISVLENSQLLRFLVQLLMFSNLSWKNFY